MKEVFLGLVLILIRYTSLISNEKQSTYLMRVSSL